MAVLSGVSSQTKRACRRLSASTALLATSLAASSALADEGPSHEGFMLRLAVGLGGAATQNDLSPSYELSGAAGFFSLDLGGTVAERLALHARIAGHSLVEPSLEVDGEDIGEIEDASFSVGSLGLGVTYYFPSNLYLTGVIGLANAQLEVSGLEFESETGFGLGADLGYEWAAGGDWGLGIAGRLEYRSIPDDPDTLSATALGVLFSATYH